MFKFVSFFMSRLVRLLTPVLRVWLRSLLSSLVTFSHVCTTVHPSFDVVSCDKTRSQPGCRLSLRQYPPRPLLDRPPMHITHLSSTLMLYIYTRSNGRPQRLTFPYPIASAQPRVYTCARIITVSSMPNTTATPSAF